MTSVSLYPRAALTNASATPVLPLVGSRMIVSFLISPRFSASSIIATPIRSLTLLIGLNDSSLASTVAPAPLVRRFSRTSGVLPIVAVIFSYIFVHCLLFSNPDILPCH